MKNIKHILFLLVIIVNVHLSFSQLLGNEWINYSQQYYKFPITKTGIHRIDYSALSSSIPINTIDPRNIQLFGMGVEIPIYIQGEGDGSFDATDFIEFFAEKSNGYIDSALYVNGAFDQMNREVSMFSDTIYYYLSWNNSTSNLRFTDETDISFSSYTPSPFYWYRAIRSYSSHFYFGRNMSNMSSAEYTTGESFYKLVELHGSGASFTENISWSGEFSGLNTSMYTSGPNSTIRVNLVSTNDPTPGGMLHHHQIYIAGNQVLEDTAFAYEANKYVYNENPSILASSTNPVSVRFTNQFVCPTCTIRDGITNIEMLLPQQFNLNNRTEQFLYLPDDASQSKSRLDITNFNTSSTPVILYDLTNRKRITVVSGASHQALVPNSGGNKKLYIASNSVVTNIGSIRPVSNDASHFAQFRDFQSTLTNIPYIMVSHKGLWTSAQAYQAYRTSTGHTNILIDIEELEDQFGFGIPHHGLSIRNFLKMTNTFWTTKPDHLFLIGKSTNHIVAKYNPSYYALSALPSLGLKPCDNMFVHNIAGDDKLYCAVGRIAAYDNSDVNDYLNKVTTYETNPHEEWMKNIIHLASDNSFAYYLDGYKNIVEDTLFGGNVNTFIQNNYTPFAITASDSIRNLIYDEGVSIMTVFGHSSGSGFDNTIDEPEDYENTGKYPVLIANGCLSGDIFDNVPLLSERFVFAPNKGSVAFLASTWLGFAPILGQIGDSIYHNFSVPYYNQSYGIAHQHAISEIVDLYPTHSLNRMNALTFQFHGDPGLKARVLALPDLMVSVENTSFEPSIITTEMDSFKLRVIVTNLGRAIGTPYNLTIIRDFPTVTPDTTYIISRPNCFYKDTIIVTMPISIVNSFGINNFTISVDNPANYVEDNELNNTIQTSTFISSSAIVPVYPYKYAVIPNDTVTLKCSTGNPYAPLTTYKIQIDTTDLFNSPFLRDTVITISGGVVRWKPPIQFTDSTCYFWRAGIDSASTGNFYLWKESTFQYIIGKYGWGQDHFFQFKDNDYLFIDHNRTTRTFDFLPNSVELRIKTHANPSFYADPNGNLSNYAIDGHQIEASGCIDDYSGNWIGYSAFNVFVIDPLTLEPWGTNDMGTNPENDFPSIPTCRSREEFIFKFNFLNPDHRIGFQALLDSMPNGYYIGGYSYLNSTFSNEIVWDNSVITMFESLGLDSLRPIVDNNRDVPYAFFAEKGDLSSTIEVVGMSNSELIILTTTLTNDWTYGSMTSELVGPASEWKSFHWQTRDIDGTPFNDTSFVNIIGVRADASEQLLISSILPPSVDMYGLNTMIDAAEYPYLKLYQFTRDNPTQTPTQINHWHVMYEGVPECALNPNVGYYFSSDSVYQGDNIRFSTAIENIGDYDMDSLTIRYFVVDANNVTHNVFVKRDSLRVGQVLNDTVTINTSSYGGINNFYIEANPIDHPEHQLEQYHFNNIAARQFTVTNDKINPMLDVTFDGIHIMDGDIVSALPFILIQLKDENEFRLLNDTGDFEIFVLAPGTSAPTKIYFNDPNINFIPASSTENYAKIEYRPDYTSQDGIYELYIRAKDRSNNISGFGDGNYDYRIKYEVINHSTITNIFNFPNPFSTSTQWVFTLTGSEIPTEFTIRIMTISGVVVREITLDELGPIHIGNNVTSFKWNGTDEYGDKLATGVYIYQVITKINGEDIEHRSTNADKYFKNDYGKLYILR